MNVRTYTPLLLLAFAVALLQSLYARDNGPIPITLYDKDPQHLWNRLHAALLTGNPEADPSATDLLDPPLWIGGKYLCEGPSHAAAISLLREFVDGGPRPERMSHLQRAVMQRALLSVFHTLARLGLDYGEPTSAGRELLTSLSLAIRHVALTPKEIAKLPDNYTVAVATPGIATHDNPARPEAFLPKELLAEDGPWIAILPESGLTATAHFETFAGRSSFEVRMRHPAGRAAGVAYLNALADMPDPLVNDPPPGVSRAPSLHQRGSQILGKGFEEGPWLNPKVPQFPVGTMWALVRRAILAAPNGEPVPSPFVESVQVRIYRTTETESAVMESPDVKARINAVDQSQYFEVYSAAYAEKVQTIFEWETRHALLLGGGGFHLTQPSDLRYAVFPFGMQTAQQIAKESPRTAPVSGTCISCHTGAGISSVQILTRRIMAGPRLARPLDFFAVSRNDLDHATIKESMKKPGWILLRWLMTGPRTQ